MLSSPPNLAHYFNSIYYEKVTNILSTQSSKAMTLSFYDLFCNSLIVIFHDPNRLPFLLPIDRSCLLKSAEDRLPSFENARAGYPFSPILTRIAANLALLTVEGVCPVFDQRSLPHLSELNNPLLRLKRILRIVHILQSIPEQLAYFPPRRFLIRVEIVLTILGRRGMLDLLHIRHTVGSLDVFPLTREEIFEVADKLHCPGEKLTVVGRALAKHVVRDRSLVWWGKCTGSDAQKNELGRAALRRILDEAVWINIHGLPGEIPVLEVRAAGGYGMRCLTDPPGFRGFLEPEKKEGWIDKYKH